MLTSGYSHKEREIIIREGSARYRNILALASRGERPIYRPSSWNKEERALKKKVKGKSWYGKCDSVVFVQSTPGEVLRQNIEKLVAGKGFNVKVVEHGGKSLKSILQRSDVAPCLLCSDDTCPLCKTEAKGSCQAESVVYKIWCRKCEENGTSAVMYGETGKTAKIRCRQHMDAFASERSSNLREHVYNVHQGRNDITFGCSVVKKYPGDALSRQLREAVLIVNNTGMSLNDKNEWVRPAHVGVRGSQV